MTGPAYRRRTEIPGMRAEDDQAIAMITALTSELAVLRERIDTLEILLAAQGVIGRQDIDEFAPDSAAAARRDGLRQRLIAKIFRPLREAAARAASEGSKP